MKDYKNTIKRLNEERQLKHHIQESITFILAGIALVATILLAATVLPITY